MDVHGSCSLPDMSFQESSVYPSTCHGARSLLQIDGNVAALVVTVASAVAAYICHGMEVTTHNG